MKNKKLRNDIILVTVILLIAVTGILFINLNKKANALDGGCWLKSFEIKDDELFLTISGYADDIDELKTSDKSAGEVILDKLAEVGKGKGIFSAEKDDFRVETEKEKGAIGEIELCIKLAKIPGQLSGATVANEEEE